jgi:UPF0755 protein
MRILLRVVGIAVLIAVIAGVWFIHMLNQPYKGFSNPVFVEFARGTSTRSMAAILAENGVIRDRWLLLAARGLRRGANLQAGEYKFDKPASPFEILGRLARGDIYYMELLVPEGFNMFDIADAVGKLGTIRPEAFLATARNPAMIRDLDPGAPSLEGYLFPNKYRVYRHTTAQQICRMMTDEFRERWKALGTRADVHATVTLAAMVEREARRPEERPLVASVFGNRLRIGMKLDCDPTTVYAALLESRYRGAIHRSDLENTSPWNTYRHAGLPPGPIANPGLSAIQAALAPADTSYLYFVAKADGSGGHNFSESLVEHDAAVARYQRATHH